MRCRAGAPKPRSCHSRARIQPFQPLVAPFPGDRPAARPRTLRRRIPGRQRFIAHERRVQPAGDFRCPAISGPGFISGRGFRLFKLLRRRAIGPQRIERELLRRRFEEGRGSLIADRRLILQGLESRAVSRRGFSLASRLRRRFRPTCRVRRERHRRIAGRSFRQSGRRDPRQRCILRGDESTCFRAGRATPRIEEQPDTQYLLQSMQRSGAARRR